MLGALPTTTDSQIRRETEKLILPAIVSDGVYGKCSIHVASQLRAGALYRARPGRLLGVTLCLNNRLSKIFQDNLLFQRILPCKKHYPGSDVNFVTFSENYIRLSKAMCYGTQSYYQAYIIIARNVFTAEFLPKTRVGLMMLVFPRSMPVSHVVVYCYGMPSGLVVGVKVVCCF